jgi:hypothetical protein
MATMRAVQVSKPGGPLEVVDRPIPEPTAGSVRIKVQACGICHSDSLTKEGLMPGIQYPRVPGHEVVGVIDAVGSDVPARWAKGLRVGVGWHAWHCGYCDSCRRGDFFACQTGPKVTGIAFDGGYAEYMICPWVGLAVMPTELPSADAAPLMCAGLTTFNALRNSGAKPGDLVAILGLGGLGHLGVQYAAKMGFRTVGIARGKDKPKQRSRRGTHQARRCKRCHRHRHQRRRHERHRRRPRPQRPAHGPRRRRKNGRFPSHPSHGQTLHRRLVLRHIDRFAGHSGVQHAVRRAVDERGLSIGESAGGLRPHDERQGAVSSGVEDGKLGIVAEVSSTVCCVILCRWTPSQPKAHFPD